MGILRDFFLTIIHGRETAEFAQWDDVDQHAKFTGNKTLQGTAGERKIGIIFDKLPPEEYKVCPDLFLPAPRIPNTRICHAQIDFVVFSQYGIFVIEVKNYNCFISGREFDRNWTCSYAYGRMRKSQRNPLRQNIRHIETIQRITKLPKSVFHNYVIIVGDVRLKRPIKGVYIFEDDSFEGCITRRKKVLLSMEKVQAAYEAVCRLDNTSEDARQEYFDSLHELYSSNDE